MCCMHTAHQRIKKYALAKVAHGPRAVSLNLIAILFDKATDRDIRPN